MVETDSVEYALRLCRAGVDCVQFDKLSPDELLAGSAELRAVNPNVVLLAAGGIDEHNAAAYAASGVDVLVTTGLFFAKPLDMSVRLLPEGSERERRERAADLDSKMKVVHPEGSQEIKMF